MRGLVIRGDLADTSLVETIQLVLSLNRTGQLAMERSNPNRSAAIYVDGGQVVHASCPPLAGEGCFYHLLTWRSGRYVFIADARPPVRSIEMSANALLLEGMRRIDDLARMESRLPPRETALLRARDPDVLAGARLTTAQWRLWRQLDGRRTVGEILDADPGAAGCLGELIAMGLSTTVADYRFLQRVFLVQTVTGAGQLDPEATDLAARMLIACDGSRSIHDCCNVLGCAPEDGISAATYLLSTRLAQVARGEDAAGLLL